MARFPGGGMNKKKQAEKPKDLKKATKRLIKLVEEYKLLFIVLIISVLIYSLINVFSNVFMQKMVASLGSYDSLKNTWTELPNKEDFYKYLIIYAIFLIAYSLFRLITDMLSAHLSVNLGKRLRHRIFAKLAKLPIGYTDSHPHGDLMSRTINDIDTVVNALSNSLTNFIGGILQVIGVFGVMIYYSPLLALICLGVLFITILSTSLLSKFMAPLQIKEYSILGQLNSETEEMVSGSKTVIAYNRQEKAIKDFAEKSNEISKIGTKAQIIGGSVGPTMNFVGNLGYFMVCIFGALFMVQSSIKGVNIGGSITGEALSISIIVTFLNLVKQFNRPISQIAEIIPQLISATAAAERTFEVLDQQEEDFSGKVKLFEKDIKGVIDFNHIYFGYNKDKMVLKDFNVDVWSGHKIALVGATGSGKTTIVNLLLRFYDINSGKITIDGVDIKDVSKKQLRDCISIVLQDPVLFQDSIENNIRYAKEDASDEEIDEALKLANCYKFVNRLPDGKKTILTEGATNISQGQRQLLTIARAILADPKILILDEATSSVDTRTEKKIQDAMVKLMANRTSIIIAHRLSTIQDADLIVVLSDGKVVEMGDHKQLIEKDGVYNRLYQTQFAGNEI